MRKLLFYIPALYLVATKLAFAVGVDIRNEIPSITQNREPVLGVISNFYEFGLIAGGLLAFGAIVFGAIKYTSSAGNPSQQGDAKQWITQALLGLLLLLGAALILQTLNPGFFGDGSFMIQLPPLELPPPNDLPNDFYGGGGFGGTGSGSGF